MTLVDTSVWVEHFRRRSELLAQRLLDGKVLTHPFVIGELACADFKNRKEIRELLCSLPAANAAEHDEALQLVDDRRLFGRGIGWIDAHLLASCRLSDCELWTSDKRLRAAATAIGVQVAQPAAQS